jgi:nucleotide-binding universal stress UspA family protein
MLALKTILHPTDFSERSALAFRLACTLAGDYGARLMIVHVAELPAIVHGTSFMCLPEVDFGQLRDQLDRLQPADSTLRVERHLTQGNAATEILRLAQDAQADVIVMGTHGRTGLSRLLMGSVAEEVMRSAMCPVVTVKAPLPSRKVTVKTVPATARARIAAMAD